MKYFILLFVLLLGCASSDKSLKSTKAENGITLTEKDSGRTITLKGDDILKITLAANATTGYKWSVAQIDTTILKIVDQKYLPSKVSKSIVGSGGEFIISLSAKRSGQTKFELEYKRPFEKNSKAQKKFNLIVTAK